MDYVALGILLGFLVFSLVMFIIIRSQSRKSTDPEAHSSNLTEPTPLYHAPDGSQAEFSRSMTSLALKKIGSDDSSSTRLGTPDTSGGSGSRSKLFFEDTGSVGYGGRRAEVV